MYDPVCGMTVNESALRLDGYDNVAFCSERCRAAFQADPGRYRLPPDDTGGDETHHHRDADH